MLTCCPQCGASQVRRSHRRGELDGLLSYVGWYPFRCETCQRRFRARWPEGQETPGRQGRIGAVVLAVGAGVVFVIGVGMLVLALSARPDLPRLEKPAVQSSTAQPGQ